MLGFVLLGGAPPPLPSPLIRIEAPVGILHGDDLGRHRHLSRGRRRHRHRLQASPRVRRAPTAARLRALPGLKALRLRNWARPPLDPRALAAVVLSHAHVDHSGYLPRLVRDGFRGPVYCTGGTADLLEVLLRDAAHLQEEEASFANRHRTSRHDPALPLFTTADAERALTLVERVDWGVRFAPATGVDARFGHAGHILGAAIVACEIGGRRLVFSGDLGRYGVPIMMDPDPVPETDVLLVESTYGDRLHPSGDAAVELIAAVRRAAEQKGWLLIPAFAVGRAQEILYELRRQREDDVGAEDPDVEPEHHVRLPANQVLERRIEDLLTRPRGRASHAPLVRYRSFQYQAASWDRPRRVIAKLKHPSGELFPRVGFIVTTLTGTNRAVVSLLQPARHGGAVDQGGQRSHPLDPALLPPFRANEVRLLLGVIAYNLGNLLRRLALPLTIQSWSLTSCSSGCSRPVVA